MSPIGPPCIPGYEGTSGDGSVPHYLPGENPSIDELTELYHIPREAMLGGAETMYPEYRKTMKDAFVRPEKCARNCGGPRRRRRPRLLRPKVVDSVGARARLRVMRTVVAATAFAVLVGMPGAIRALPQSASGGGKSAPKAWAPPRTPWGDPDSEARSRTVRYTTPLERPDRFAGRRLEDIKDAELAEVRRDALQRNIDTLPGGRVRGPDYWWVTNLHLGHGSQAWLVTDPPDGRIPALTPEALLRARTTRVRSSFLGGPFDSPEDLGLLDRCISRSVPGSMIPVMYGNTYEIAQVPGYVVIDVRDHPRDAHHPSRRPSSHRTGNPPAHGRPPRPLRGQHARRRDDEFHEAAAYRGATEGLRVIERFARVAPDRIAWTATIDDPATWTRPWTIGLPLTSDPQPVMAFECHEGNYGLRNILSAARAEDR